MINTYLGAFTCVIIITIEVRSHLFQITDMADSARSRPDHPAVLLLRCRISSRILLSVVQIAA